MLDGQMQRKKLQGLEGVGLRRDSGQDRVEVVRIEGCVVSGDRFAAHAHEPHPAPYVSI